MSTASSSSGDASHALQRESESSSILSRRFLFCSLIPSALLFPDYCLRLACLNSRSFDAPRVFAIEPVEWG
eukprot:CAMPEP_0180207240 /NCGR_PEP_ID=MMETSP0987-20121128/10011_1 /TAXON_ID=697907 /ORGANISM="non described non described, Strain CCMP2293" /LENGTH=70 /DNA_ID=CAMNT_0022163127 /DNA_START=710 /DNA_END=918 /DNA_ORIENTATION=+